MPHDLPKAYDPAGLEDHWAEYWVREKLFAQPTPRAAHSDAQPEAIFTILLPPPNVTGRLHMGHMLNQTEMDILSRWRRMSGATCAVASRHRSRGHRHADDGGASVDRRGLEPPAAWAARPLSNASGSGSATTAAQSSTR